MLQQDPLSRQDPRRAAAPLPTLRRGRILLRVARSGRRVDRVEAEEMVGGAEHQAAPKGVNIQ